MTQPTTKPVIAEGGISAYRAYVTNQVTLLGHDMETASNQIALFEQTLVAHQTAAMNLREGKLGPIAVGGIATLTEVTMSQLAVARTAMQAAEQGKATAEMLLEQLNRVHAPAQEVVAAGGVEVAGNTDWYRD